VGTEQRPAKRVWRKKNKREVRQMNETKNNGLKRKGDFGERKKNQGGPEEVGSIILGRKAG